MRKYYYYPEKEALQKARVYVDLLLTKGIKFQFARFPLNDYTATLLDGLKKHGFVASGTRLCHFRVLWGIPLQEEETPFEPIIWKKNKQLLLYFVRCLFGGKWYVFKNLFADRNGNPVTFPHYDKDRLEYSPDYPILEKLLKNEA